MNFKKTKNQELTKSFYQYVKTYLSIHRLNYINQKSEFKYI